MPLIDKNEVNKKLEENKKRNVKELDIVEQFKEEMNLLNEAQKEIDEIYEDIHDHYLKVRNAKGTLMFTQSQTSNLVSLKTTKINIIRERINLKRSILDFELKCAPKDQDDSLDAAMIGEILRQLNNKDAEEKIKYTDEEIIEDENSNEELEKRLNILEQEGKVSFNEIERNVALEKEGANEIDVNSVVKDIMVNKQNYELNEEEKALKKEKEQQFDWVYNEETDDVVKVPRKPSEDIVFVENNEETIEEEQPDFNVNPLVAQLMEQQEDEEEIEYVYEDNDDEYEEECEIVVIADKDNYNNWDFAAIDKDGNIVDDYILPSKSVAKVTFQIINGEVAPVDVYGEVYRLILR